ncbi:MAG TPA: hypothetical protein VGW10_02105 [Solirubrobacteraceae bacterium]|nr:hypothetical protein [Solirubrobacteraceae bacterium]
MRILVLAREAVDAARVRSALPGDDLSDAEVLVVAPAEEQSALKFWMSDADDAIADASERGEEVADELRSEGAHARTETGESDPVLAVRDALATFPADRILVFGDEELAQQVRSSVDVEVTAAR